MLPRSIREGGLYTGEAGNVRRVQEIVQGEVTYLLLKKTGVGRGKQGDTRTCTLTTFASWATGLADGRSYRQPKQPKQPKKEKTS